VPTPSYRRSTLAALGAGRACGRVRAGPWRRDGDEHTVEMKPARCVLERRGEVKAADKGASKSSAQCRGGCVRCLVDDLPGHEGRIRSTCAERSQQTSALRCRGKASVQLSASVGLSGRVPSSLSVIEAASRTSTLSRPPSLSARWGLIT